LLKSIEEPAPRTVWLLCAPNPEEVIVTIRSRCRKAELVTPSAAAISRLLQHRDGVDAKTAEFAARVAQGHVGRARALATDPEARARRKEILELPARLTSLGNCLAAAADVIAAATDEAAAITTGLDAAEQAELSAMVNFTGGRAKGRSASAALKELEEKQKKRRTRLQRDCLDRVLTELTSYYRDVLAQQTNAETAAINAEQAAAIDKLARATTPEATLRKLEAILGCRKALMQNNVAQLLAVESLLLSLAA
jgi:DNA polymerase-3 subunit delta'